MNAEQQVLWNELRTFPFQPPSAPVTFASRLARENGWTDDYARRVVDEYRRFLFLAQIAGHPVSPSEDVDQAWHLHLAYTRNYWDELCGKVLGRPFHHEPAQGHEGEAARLRKWYNDTLNSYRRIFGEAPPWNIWPSTEERFRDATSFVRVNRQRAWLIPKPRRAGLVGAGLAGFVALLSTGCGRDVFLAVGGPWDLTGPEFLLLYTALFFVALLAAVLTRYWGRGPGAKSWMPEERPDPYELAYLAGYRPRALQAALANLLQRGHLVFNSSAPWQILTGDPLPPGAHWFERDVFEYVRNQNVATYPDLRFSGRLREQAETLDERLVELRCLMPAGRAFWLRTWTAALFVILLCFGLSKVHVGLARQRPVEFLIACCIGTAPVAAAFFFWKTRPTRRGKALLRELRDHHSEFPNGPVSPRMSGADVAITVALFGSTVLAGSTLARLHTRFVTYGAPGGSGSGSNTSTGCSTSGGGGCGGGGGGSGGGGGCGGV